MKFFVFGILVYFVSGCASGTYKRKPHAEYPRIENSKMFDLSRDKLWEKLVPSIGKSFYSINNVDKSSGLVNLSFSGNPKKYVDCGYLETSVENLHGPRSYRVDLSDEYSRYETFDSGTLYQVDRELSLSGRINLIVESVGSKSKVTVNTRYVLTKTSRVSGGVDNNYRVDSNSFVDSASFDTLGSGLFKGGTKCVSTGLLEREVLELIK